MVQTVSGNGAQKTRACRCSSATERGQTARWISRKAETVVAQNGQRLLSLSSERSAIFIIDWDLKAGTLASSEYQRILL